MLSRPRESKRREKKRPQTTSIGLKPLPRSSKRAASMTGHKDTGQAKESGYSSFGANSFCSSHIGVWQAHGGEIKRRRSPQPVQLENIFLHVVTRHMHRHVGGRESSARLGCTKQQRAEKKSEVEQARFCNVFTRRLASTQVQPIGERTAAQQRAPFHTQGSEKRTIRKHQTPYRRRTCRLPVS